MGAEDALWVPELPSPEFKDYLEAAGLRPPTFSRDLNPGERLYTPFGWNAEAHRVNARHGSRARGPSLETARKVNSRAFGAALEARLFPEDACPARFWARASELKAGLATLAPGRYRAKGNFGLAGIGHLGFEAEADGAGRAKPLAPARVATLCRLVERHAGAVVEREDDVALEFGVLFRAGRAGRSALRAHRLWTFADGGFAGALALPGEDPLFAPWRARVEDAATKISAALAREDYFGPVSLDTYIRRDAADPAQGAPARLRPLVDLNARASMAWPAHGLAARFPGRAAAVVQLPAAALHIPRDPAALARAWGPLAFTPARGEGALWLTPFDHGRDPLPRHSLGFIGADAAAVEQLRDGVLKISLRDQGARA